MFYVGLSRGSAEGAPFSLFRDVFPSRGFGLITATMTFCFYLAFPKKQTRMQRY